MNHLTVDGSFSVDDLAKLSAAIYNCVNKRDYKDITLDFSNCTRAHQSEMLPLAAMCQNYWKKSVDINLDLPMSDKLKRLFLNTNWAHLIDIRKFEESRFKGYTHVPAMRYSTAGEQHACVDRVINTLLSAIRHLSRDDLRAIEWSINEITDNVINHSDSSVGGFVQVTNHIQAKKIEFAVCDCGLGIPSTLRNGHRDITSDHEALDRAIREGVTRDNSVGQGNGLYGTWRITKISNGNFKILSNYASLISDADTVRVSGRDVPFQGTMVVARIGYGERLDLSEALTFSGKKYVPGDYIDSHFEQDDEGNVKFVLGDEADGFGSRAAGDPVRRKLRNLIACAAGGRAIVDCKGVHLVSSSFADEVFGKLFVEMGPIDFSRSIEFKRVDPLVRDLIDKAIMQRMRQ